ncbi:hypothetical protein ACOI1C_01435 [Bacillus sp. DJP31]|uniref:hypothetical protein n=1 Tax=Bacillus sp. DJP31 TaxID=3409789 RepID=UPI003BB7268A
MNPIQVMQSILRSDRTNRSHELTIRPGQLLHGRVEKLFPNQTALIQIGSMKLYAHIDVSLEALERYWFEAQPDQNGEVHLKVLETKNSGRSNINDLGSTLLTQFQLPDTKKNQQLVKFLISKELPFSKEHVTKGSQWLTSKQDFQKGLTAIEMMIKRELPVTNQTFKSLVAFQSSSSIATQLLQVTEWLGSDKLKQSETTQQLKSQLHKLVGAVTVEQGQKVVSELVKLWLSPTSTVSEQQSSFRLLQKLELLPKSFSLEQSLQSVAKQLNIEWTGHSTIARLSSDNRSQFAESFVHKFPSQQQNKFPLLIQELLQNPSQSIGEDELALIKQVRTELMPKSVQLENGTEVKQLFKQMIYSLGLDYENELGKWSKANFEAMDELDSLKPLLIKAMSELGTSGRELEPLLNRLTGIQMLSQETNGPLQQLFMQFPLALGDKLSDVTLQWSGRNKKDGQIDSSFCRILFYLDLQNIKQTVIDMHVQNRIVNITIFNHTEGMESSVSRQQLELKDQLGNLGYTLSSVKVTDHSLLKNDQDDQIQTHSLFTRDSYQGVDIKI